MPGEYLPVLLQILVAILFAASALIVSVLVGKSGKRTPAKDIPYECGMIPQGERQPRFSVKFYVVAMLLSCSTLRLCSCTRGQSCTATRSGRAASFSGACSASSRF